MSSILIVDDEPDIADVLGELLRLEGWEVTTRNDGLGALEALERRTFDVVVSDVMMPRLNGADLLERLRAADRWRDLPVVLVSAGPIPERARAMATAAVHKPFDLDAFLGLLDQLRGSGGSVAPG